MEIEKSGLRNIFLMDFIIGMIAILMLKLYNPEFANLAGLMSAVFSRDVMAIFYICCMGSFLLISYISFWMGLYVVYSRTIGKIINDVKEFMGKYNFKEYDYYGEFEEFSAIDILLFVTYMVLVMPLMLYALLPGFAAVLGFIFITYCFIQALSN